MFIKGKNYCVVDRSVICYEPSTDKIDFFPVNSKICYVGESYWTPPSWVRNIEKYTFHVFSFNQSRWVVACEKGFEGNMHGLSKE